LVDGDHGWRKKFQLQDYTLIIPHEDSASDLLNLEVGRGDDDLVVADLASDTA
jgi:hypothetical protein